MNFTNILRAINRRNHIIHKTGNLAKEIQENQIRQDIYDVLNLSLLLAHRRNQITNSPEMQKIGKEISDSTAVPTFDFEICVTYLMILY